MLERSVVLSLFVAVALLAASPAAAQPGEGGGPPGNAGPPIPVGCGDVLAIPGGKYKLGQDMNCNVDPAILVVADDIKLDLGGHTLSCTAPMFGIAVVSSRHVSIKDGTVSTCLFGILLQDAHDSSVKEMVVTDALQFGIILFNASNNDVNNNVVVRGGSKGIGLLLSSDNDVRDNVVTGSAVTPGGDDGISLGSNSNGNQVRGNEAYGWGRSGLLVNDSSNNTLKGNIANDNLVFGIVLSDDGLPTLNNEVIDNVTNHNFVGLAMDDGVSGTVVRQNVANHNRLGFAVLGKIATGVIPEGNLFEMNAAFGNSDVDLAEFFPGSFPAEFFPGFGVVEPCRNIWQSNDFDTQLGPDTCIE